MIREWKLVYLLIMLILILSACGKQFEDQANAAIEASGKVFIEDSKAATDEIEGVKLFKPRGYVISGNSDEKNIVLTKKSDTFLLFINPEEQENSQLLYNLLLEDSTKKIIAQKTFTKDERFGFAAIIESDEDYVELVASSGGIKITAITLKKNIKEHLENMMEIVRSINQLEK